MSGDVLHQELRTRRGGMVSSHATRLHRAISWLRCAEQYADADEDVSFIALWISFNSCYSINRDETSQTFWTEFQMFTNKLVALDEDRRIYNCLWFNFSKFVRLLIDNQWVFGPFWQSQQLGDEDWKKQFEGSKKRAYSALANDEA